MSQLKVPQHFSAFALVKKNLPRFLVRDKQKVTRLPGFATGLQPDAREAFAATDSGRITGDIFYSDTEVASGQLTIVYIGKIPRQGWTAEFRCSGFPAATR